MEKKIDVGEIFKNTKVFGEEGDDEKFNEAKFILRECADNIETVLRKYCDMQEDYYKLATVWIIGSYLHKSFESYPYLFINATKGGGKTRLLKLITALGNGLHLVSMREAVLFRLPKNQLVCIDEFEGLNKKENTGLRELLNASYKKGVGIQRVKRVSSKEGDKWEIENFEPYKPIVMANIWGMEEVLGDRSITLILDKSNKANYTKIMEDFDENPLISDIKVRLNHILVQLCSVVYKKKYIGRWNEYIKLTTNTLYTYTTQTTQTTHKPLDLHEMAPEKTNSTPNSKDLTQQLLFDSIYKTDIDGRNLELFFPLFLTADLIGDDWCKKMLEIGSRIVGDRNTEEMTQSRDVMLLDFISKLVVSRSFQQIKELTYNFKEYVGEDEGDDKWINTRWFGRALKRLNLIIDKRRVNKGVEVVVNSTKALEQLKIFQSNE